MKKFKYLGIIPARIGSQSIKNKNILKINKMPLFYYAANALIKSKLIDDKIYSTDSSKISNYAVRYGYKQRNLRPKRLSGNKTKIVDVLKYELLKENKKINYDYMVLVQPTSPTVTTQIINKAINIVEANAPDNLITGYDCGMQHPSTFFEIKKNNSINWLVNDVNRDSRRQDFKTYFIRTGLVYIIKSSLLIDGKFYGNKINYLEISKEKSITIDNYSDFLNAKDFFRINKNK
jgi:CMP-N,N'-diacetyllegionaminic acid synthase